MTKSRALIPGIALSALAVTLALVPRADAQVERGGGGVSPQLQQLAAERAALQAENAQLKLHADELQKKLDAATQQQSVAQGKLSHLQQEAARSTEAQQASTAAAEKMQAQLTEVVTRFREMAQSLKDVEADRTSQRTRADAAERGLASCVDHNAQMYLLADEFLNRVEHRGFWSRVADKEPVTRLSHIRLENLADDYRQRIEELRLHNGAPGARGAAGAAGGSQAAAPHDQPKH